MSAILADPAPSVDRAEGRRFRVGHPPTPVPLRIAYIVTAMFARGVPLANAVLPTGGPSQEEPLPSSGASALAACGLDHDIR